MDGHSKYPQNNKWNFAENKTKMEKLIMSLMKFFGKFFLILVLVAIFPGFASADGRSYLVRRSELCEDLGYLAPGEYGDCTINYEFGKYAVEITLTVDEDVDEPNMSYDTRLPGGSVQVSFIGMNAQFGDIFMPIQSAQEYWWDFISILIHEYSAPCLSPECTKGKAIDPTGYHGVTEENLTDLALIRSKLPLQSASRSMANEIQRMLNTKGWPVITEVLSVWNASNNVSNSGATILKAIVFVRVAKYGTAGIVTVNNVKLAPVELPVTISVDPRLEK